jgi:mono/diheme cytochrome c family protein
MTRRGGLALALALPAAAAALWGVSCRQDMHDQPRYKPMAESAFFGDQRSARPLVEGTVARGHLDADVHASAGKQEGALATAFPAPVTSQVLSRGRERFQIFCAPCHGLAGYADGMVVKRGLRRPPSFHIDRLRNQPPGYLFDVVTRGFGAMPDYAAQIPPADRWAIVAYVRALQLSQNARIEDVPPEERDRLVESEAGR